MKDTNPIGRPRFSNEKQRRHNITLSDSLYEKAKVIGNGNASNGIRIALEKVK